MVGSPTGRCHQPSSVSSTPGVAGWGCAGAQATILARLAEGRWHRRRGFHQSRPQAHLSGPHSCAGGPRTLVLVAELMGHRRLETTRGYATAQPGGFGERAINSLPTVRLSLCAWFFRVPRRRTNGRTGASAASDVRSRCWTRARVIADYPGDVPYPQPAGAGLAGCPTRPRLWPLDKPR